MLTDHPIATTRDRLSDIVSLDNGNSPIPRKIADGVYERGDFSINAVYDTQLIDDNPALKEGHSFGVCDNYQQILKAIPELTVSARKFFLTLTLVKRSEEEAAGWCWRKWGPYIGDHTPTSDYLDDEPVIDKVYVYHIYEVIDRNSLH